MKVETNENITTITQEKASAKTITSHISHSYEDYIDNHIIVDLSNIEMVTLEDIITFLRLSNTHRAAKKSFVIITDSINNDDIPDEIVVVPTSQEAHDIIEMEAIERDLGF